MKITKRQLRKIILEFANPAPAWPQQHFAWRETAFTRDDDIRYILDIANPESIKAADAIGEPYPPGTNVTYISGRFNPPEELPEKIHVHDSELLDIIESEGWYQKPPPEGAHPEGFWAATGEWMEDSPDTDWDLPPDDGMEEPLIEGNKMKITKKQLKRIIKEEYQKLLKESEQYIYRTQDGELRISDDDGNDEPYPQGERQYSHLRPGDGQTITGGGRGYSRGRGRSRRRW